MKFYIPFFTFFLVNSSLSAQRSTPNEGDWSKQIQVLRNTAEADLMIRVGDIDNLNNGFPEEYDPFSGRATDAHPFPWTLNKNDTKGTDRIMVPGSYKYGSPVEQDGYTSSTKRPDNNPGTVTIPLKELKTVKMDSASLQLFIDDFQAPYFHSKFQVKLNGLRFTEAEKMISLVNQTGPIGKLITLRLTPELMQKLNSDSLVIAIDDPVSKQGDGYAIDFVKLLINPKIIYKGKIQGRVVDDVTRSPISGATVSVDQYGSTLSDEEGFFTLENIPAGLVIVNGHAAGFSSDSKQADVISGETTENVELILKKSGKVNFNNASLQEGDNLVLNNIQFAVNSAVLQAAGKAELDKLVTLMKENPGIEIQLSGHTSSEGTAAANRELSLNRVRSCKDYLVSKGIDDGRILIRGFGPDKPVAPNDTEAGRAKNRRVEMTLIKL